MNRDRATMLLVDFTTALTSLWLGSGLLAGLAAGDGAWVSGGPTDRMRDDLVSTLDRFRATLAQLGDDLYPPMTAEVREAAQAFGALLETWQPPELSADLGQAAVLLASCLAKAMYSPAPPPVPEPEAAHGIDERGLPFPRAGLRTAYSPAAGALFATADAPFAPHRMTRRRMFVRRIDEPTYREVVLPGDRLVPDDVVLCATAPVAYVHGLQLTNDESGANDAGIFRVTLPDGEVQPIQQHRSGGWISRLLGASADGATLHVIATTTSVAGAESCGIGYGLATFDIETGLTAELAALPGIFA